MQLYKWFGDTGMVGYPYLSCGQGSKVLAQAQVPSSVLWLAGSWGNMFSLSEPQSHPVNKNEIFIFLLPP